MASVIKRFTRVPTGKNANGETVYKRGRRGLVREVQSPRRQVAHGADTKGHAPEARRWGDVVEELVRVGSSRSPRRRRWCRAGWCLGKTSKI